MRHVYVRGILAMVWLAVAILCGVSGNFAAMPLYAVIGGVFLYSAYAAWKKGQKGEGGR